MALVVALAAALAGGNLGVTTAPRHPVAGSPVRVYATGQVGDTGGRLYVFHNLSRPCADTASGERRRGRLVHPAMAVDGAFELRTRFVPHRAGPQWVCSYLYAITCEAGGTDCGPAVGVPPDAGFSRNRISVRPPRRASASRARR
ncbi:MAG: hypothetical protein ACJ76Z_02540 [Thermoleophilaceae bacterium]